MSSSSNLQADETSEPASVPTGSPTLGRKLATLRSERRLTLREVALGCGLAESFLSKLERDKVNISVGNLGKIANFYRVPIGFFFDGGASHSHGTIVHAAEYPRLTRSNSTVKMYMLLPHHHSMDAILIDTPPKEGEDSHHLPCTGDEFTYIIHGQLRYWVDDEEYLLSTGDTIYHRSDIAHRWENIGSENALAITVCLPNPNQYNTSSHN